MRTPAPAVLAVVLPLLVAVGAISAAGAARDAELSREIGNAGRVLNGRRLPHGVQDAVAERLRRSRPEVLVLGNSNANTDIDEAQLAAELGVRPDRVVVLSIPNSVGAHWYALLRNHVYGAGHRPRQVLIVTRLQLALATEPLSEAGYLNLEALLTEDEPVVEARTGRTHPWMRRLRQDRSSLRDLVVHGARDLGIALLPDRYRAERSRRALDRVFADRELDPDRSPQVAPRPLPPPAESYLPDLRELARQHGSDLVLVRPPWSDAVHHHQADIVPVGTGAEVARLLDGGLVDLSSLPFDRGDFANPTHLEDDAARRFTAALAEALRVRQAPTRAGLLGTVQLRDGVWSRDEGTFTELRPPPKVHASAIVEDGLGHVPLPDAAFLADPYVRGLHPLRSRCSPLRVLRDGVQLPAGRPCPEISRGRQASCHDAAGLWFAASTATVEVALDPGRDCDGARWLYPGDAWEGRWIEPISATELVIEGSPLGVPGADLQVQLVVDGGAPLTAGVALGQLAAGPVRLPVDLDRPEDVVLRLHNPSGAFVLLTRIELR